MMDSKTIMLIGLGGVGEAALEFLAREEGIGKIVVGSRNEEHGCGRCNLINMAAIAQGYHPDIQFVPLDLNQVDATADAIFHAAPDIILSTASMMTWWYPNLFPEQQREVLHSAGFGMWLPVHLNLIMKLMQTLKLLSYKRFSLNASFPDVVNPILKIRGLTPTAGIGNLDEVVPKVKLLGANRQGIQPQELKVTMVAHHAIGAWVFRGRTGHPPPYYVRADYNGRDVTKDINADKLLFEAFPLTRGPIWNNLSASSAIRMVKALLSEDDIAMHANGPNGLPGGYPVNVSCTGIELRLPPDLSLEEAVSINESSHPYDGVQGIEPDGSVIFCQESVEIMRQTLGYECERLLPWENETRANELISCFQSFASDQGVELPKLG